MRSTWSRFLFVSWHLQASTLDREPGWCFESPSIHVSWEYNLVDGHRPIQGKIGRKSAIYTCNNVLGFLLKGISLPVNQCSLSQKTSLDLKLDEGPWFSTAVADLTNHLARSQFFLVIQVKDHHWLLIYVIPKNTTGYQLSRSHSVATLVLLSLIIIMSTLPLLVKCHNLASAILNHSCYYWGTQ